MRQQVTANRPGPSSGGGALVEGYVPENARIDTDQIPPKLRVTPLLAAVKAVRQLITILIEHCARNLRPIDLTRFCFDVIGLLRRVSTTLVTVSSLSVERVVGAIMIVLKSYKHLKLEHGFTVDVIINHRYVGGGHTKVLDIDRLERSLFYLLNLMKKEYAVAILLRLSTFKK
ncbi:hypothetical protein AVEN_102530-1 [Araneus ventricosus]|uniref:Uncharacterized protein n=1 Tax=Araneus ventricosus TaxID=182803 RepID=A0A4Y2BI76_ARAVE|nr:hypothetical protein AVEN_102530-1 [Araneus ventricosus]